MMFENQMPSVQACEYERQFLNYNCFFIFLFFFTNFNRNGGLSFEQENRSVVNHGIVLHLTSMGKENSVSTTCLFLQT